MKKDPAMKMKKAPMKLTAAQKKLPAKLQAIIKKKEAEEGSAAKMKKAAMKLKDAHYSGRNILAESLPNNARLIRGWSGHPYSMVQEIDSSFDALIMIGYHSRASSSGNPLAHTMSSSKLDKVLINEQAASEFFLHGHIASKYKVPLVFLSGDAGICDEVKKVSPNTKIHATMVGVGNSTISTHPEESRIAIKSKVKD